MKNAWEETRERLLMLMSHLKRKVLQELDTLRECNISAFLRKPHVSLEMHFFRAKGQMNVPPTKRPTIHKAHGEY